MRLATCSVKGCDHPVQGREWCSTHYSRWRIYGSPMGYLTLEQQLLERIVIDDNGCWLWTAHLSRGKRGSGYGKHGKDYAHRLAYEVWVGSIPPDKEIDHLCRVRRCIRPAHLEVVSRQTNLLRGETFAARHAATTHCPQGHRYDEANTRWSSIGQRSCRFCHNAQQRAYIARKKGVVK